MAASAGVSSVNSRPPVLNSWKEIASYLGRGVRTVQRYERELDLPVRRLKGKSHASVVAWPRDLDAWLQHVAIDEAASPLKPKNFTVSSLAMLVAANQELRHQAHQLRVTNERALHDLVATLSMMMQKIELCKSQRAQYSLF